MNFVTQIFSPLVGLVRLKKNFKVLERINLNEICSISFRDMQKSAESQDLEYSLLLRQVMRKHAGWFSRIQQTFLASKYYIKQHFDAT